MLNAFQVTGLARPAQVLLIGLGTLPSLVPLACGRRAMFELVLMATAMTIPVLEPRLWLMVVGVGAYVAGFLGGLWLLLGPGPPGTGGPAASRR